MSRIKVGDKVRSTFLPDNFKPYTYYPPLGTIGTVLNVDDSDAYIEWPEGTVITKNIDEYPTAWYYPVIGLEVVG